MHKIDKHTGLYLEWGGPYLTPLGEMRDVLLEEDATLDDLASQINDFLLTKSLGFRNKVRRGILDTLPDNFNANTRLWDLVITYPTTALKVVEDLDYKRELDIKIGVTSPQEELQEEYQPYVVCHIIRSSNFYIVVDKDIFKKGQVVYLEDNEPMTIKSNPKSDGFGYAYETDIYNQFVPWTRIYAFKR